MSKHTHPICIMFMLLIGWMFPAGGQTAIDTTAADTILPVVKMMRTGISESVTDTQLHTISLRRADLEVGYPILKLEDEGSALTLSFDDLGGGVEDYYYTFEHCNRSWEPSGLSTFDYLDGFEENRITDYSFSFGTLQRYTHYQVSFPNDDIRFLISGNYLVYVWKGDNRDTAVITKRFFIWEDAAAVSGRVYRPNLIPYRNEFQEVNFTADIRNLDIANAFDEVSATILQNGRYDHMQENIQPRMITNDLLTYDMDDLVFPGGKEYRRFDTKTLNFQSDRIVRIEQRDGGYHAYINTEESRVFERYTYEKDANGQFVVRADLANNMHTESDYARIYFTLQYPYMITSGEVYVTGMGLPPEGIRMEYDFDRMQYRASAYLKQGYYNYMYAVRLPDTGYLALDYTEGNSFETENDYIILLYQHVFSRDYDRLIACTVINSVK